MGHILGSDIVPETAAVTAGTHPATFATGMLLVVFVSIVWKCFPSQWDTEGYFFLEKSRKTKKTQNLHNCPDEKKKKTTLQEGRDWFCFCTSLGVFCLSTGWDYVWS